MVYKRYIKKGGKVYGPYAYHSHKKDGKVISKYLGKHEEVEKKNNFSTKKILTLILVGLVFIIGFLLMNSFFVEKVFLSPEERFVVLTDTNYLPGEEIKGSVKINLLKGELIPYDTKLIIDNVGEKSEFLLGDLIFMELVEGNFYVQGTEIVGNGNGYGVIGEKKLYPEVSFVMEVVDEDRIEAIPGDPIEEDEIPVEEEPIVESDDSELLESPPIFVEGVVSGDDSFEFELFEGEEVEIVSSSYPVILTIEDDVAIITTDYFESEQGFGEDYVVEGVLIELNIDLSSLHIPVKSGLVRVYSIHDVALVGSEFIRFGVGEDILEEVNQTNITEPIVPELELERINNLILEKNLKVDDNVISELLDKKQARVIIKTKGVPSIGKKLKNLDYEIVENFDEAQLSLLEDVDVVIDQPVSLLLTESETIIRSSETRTEFGLTGIGKKVCVIDTGVDYNHPDIINYQYGWDFVNNDSDPLDDNGHGTSVSGIISKIAPSSELIVAKVIDLNGNGYESNVLEGLQYCIEQNVDVISFSIGAGNYAGYCDSNIVAELVNVAVGQGIFVTAATGNDGSILLKTPSCASGATRVSSTTKLDEIADFANVNELVNVFVPGENIEVPVLGSATDLKSGTSMSAPMVAGAAALVLENEVLSPEELRYRFATTGLPISYNSVYISRLDVYNAVVNNVTMNLTDNIFNQSIGNETNFTGLAFDSNTCSSGPDRDSTETQCDIYACSNAFNCCAKNPAYDRPFYDNGDPAGYVWDVEIPGVDATNPNCCGDDTYEYNTLFEAGSGAGNPCDDGGICSGVETSGAACCYATESTEDCYYNGACYNPGNLLGFGDNGYVVCEDVDGNAEYGSGVWQDCDANTGTCSACGFPSSYALGGEACSTPGLDKDNETCQSECCGDDLGENVKTCVKGVSPNLDGNCLGDEGDTACCAEFDNLYVKNKCIYDNTCYDPYYGAGTGAHDISMQTGENTVCDSGGSWRDCDDMNSITCLGSCGGQLWAVGPGKGDATGEASFTACCGDDIGEVGGVRYIDTGCTGNNCPPFSTSLTDKACCSTLKCVYSGDCYGGGISNLGGENIFCDTSGAATWYDCDASSDIMCTGSCGLEWVVSGEASVGEYASLGATECCGDDISENITTNNFDSGDKACCISSDSCVMSATCYNNESLSGNGNHYCNSGEWVNVTQYSSIVGCDPLIPTLGIVNFIINSSIGTCDSKTWNLKSLNITSGGNLVLTNADISVGKTNVLFGGNLTIKNSQGTVWQNGNLTIGGYYNLDNSKLRMNGTVDGEVEINVKSSGIMIINNTANITNGEDVDFNYGFIVDSGAGFNMTDSYLSYAGWEDVVDNKGLEIYTDNVIIYNNTFYENYIGIVVSGGYFSNISSNNFSHLGKHGIVLFLVSENNIIQSNEINLSPNGMYGIHLHQSDNNNITSNRIFLSDGSKGVVVEVDSGGNIISFNELYSENTGIIGILLINTLNKNFIYHNNVTLLGVGISYGITLDGSTGGLKDNDISENNFILNSSSSSAMYLIDRVFDNNFTNNKLTTAGSSISLVGGATNGVYNNIFTETKFLNFSAVQVYSVGGAYDNKFLNATINLSGVEINSFGTNNLTIQWYVRVNVSDSNGKSISGAIVNISDVNSVSDTYTSTDSQGLTPWKIISDKSMYWDDGDKETLFNDHVINVSKVYYIENVSDYNLNKTMYLDVMLESFSPNISFVPPTPDSGTFINRDWLQVNVSVNDTSANPYNLTAFIDWNYTLLGWWMFNESLYDASSWSHDASCSACPAWISNGKFGSALEFDGINDFVGVPSFSDNPEFGSYAIEFWAKRPSGDVGAMPISKGGGTVGWWFRADGSSGKLYFVVGDGSDSALIMEGVRSDDDEWHHFVGIVDRELNRTRLYKDGIYQNYGNIGLVDSIYSPSNTLYIGVGPTTGTNNPNSAYVWKGPIDEVRIHKRALSPEEIKASFNAGVYNLSNNFSGLSHGSYDYTAYVQNLGGNLNQTGTRILNVDFVNPDIGFIYPTPPNKNVSLSSSVFVNVSVNDSSSQDNFTAFVDWDRSLKAWWRFSEGSGSSAYDSSSWGNTCNFGVVGPIWTYFGKFGRGLVFDGHGDLLNCGDDSSLEMTDEITVEAWVKPNADSVYGRIVEKGFDLPGSWILAKVGPAGERSNHWTFTLVNEVGTQKHTMSTKEYTDNIGQWTHLVGTYDRTIRKLYVNGVLQEYPPDNPYDCTGLLGTGRPVLISKDDEHAFNGTMDEVKLWDRVLSSEEINASYNAGVKNRIDNNFQSLTEDKHTYISYVQDMAGNLNSTEMRSFSYDNSYPVIGFVSPPTLNDGAFVAEALVDIRVDLTELSLANLTFNWNDTNISLYDNDLLLLMNFNNISALGENDTYMKDVSMYENDGICVSGSCPILTQGKYNSGYEFDGINDYINISNSPSIDVVGTGISFSAWVSLPILGVTDGVIVSMPGDSKFHKYGLEYESDGGGLVKCFIESDSPGALASTNFVVNEWQHITCVYNGTDLVIYINGEEEGTFPETVSMTSSGNDLFVGRGKISLPQYFKGTIDDIRIYNRSLNDSEIQQVYASNLYKYDNDGWVLNMNEKNEYSNSINYFAYAQDMLGRASQTETRSLAGDFISPLIDFVDPTLANESSTSRDWVEVNISINESHPKIINYTWNETTYHLYDEDLLLLMNFDNVDALGEGSTYMKDVSLYENDGNCVVGNCPVFTQGKYSGGFNFEREVSEDNSDIIVVDDNVGIKSLHKNFTLSTWVYATGLGEADSYVLMGTGRDIDSDGYCLQINPQGYLTFTSFGPNENYPSDYFFPEGTWVHVVAVINDTEDGAVTLYINGSFQYGKSFVSPMIKNMNDYFSIGALKDSEIANPFNGIMDDVRIYNRSLTADEVKKVYASNLYKYDVDMWALYINQSVPQRGIYTYFSSIEDLAGNFNRTEIRTLEKTCGEINQNTVLTSDQASEGTCFTVTAGGITLDCAGHKITYDNGSDVGTSYGIYLKSNGITIKDCIIEEGNSAFGDHAIMGAYGSGNYNITNNTINTSGASSAHGIYFDNSDNNHIAYNNFTVTGTSSKGIRIGGVNNSIYENIVTTTDGFGAYALWLTSGGNSSFFNNIFTTASTSIYMQNFINNSFANSTINNPSELNIYSYQSSYDNIFTNVSLDDSKISVEGGNLTLQWYFIVNVTNESFQPEENVVVNVSDISGKSLLYQSTLPSGFTDWVTVTDRIFYPGSITTFNNHSINLTKDPYVSLFISYNITKTELYDAILVLNSRPTVILNSPGAGYNTTNRTPTFGWTGNDVDDNGEITGYELNITCYNTAGGGCSSCGDSDLSRGLDYRGAETSYVLERYLRCLRDNNYYYNWTVRANDSYGFGPWAEPRIINLSALVSINLTRDLISFGTIAFDGSDDTEDDNPEPFALENIGNVFVNISMNATSLWRTELIPSVYYRYRFDNYTGPTSASDENGSFNWSRSQMVWTNVPVEVDADVVLVDFNWSSATDSLEMHVNVTVPGNKEGAGNRNSWVQFIASLAE